MKTLCLSLALLGQRLNPLVEDMLRESDRKHTEEAVQTQRDMTARSIAYDDREAERENVWIIAGAIVGGLMLMGLLARGGQKK